MRYLAGGPLAQRLELPAHNRLVPGSNPGGPTSPAASRRQLTTDNLQLTTDSLQTDSPDQSSAKAGISCRLRVVSCELISCRRRGHRLEPQAAFASRHRRPDRVAVPSVDFEASRSGQTSASVESRP